MRPLTCVEEDPLGMRGLEADLGAEALLQGPVAPVQQVHQIRVAHKP
jgi:hypothetical protein